MSASKKNGKTTDPSLPIPPEVEVAAILDEADRVLKENLESKDRARRAAKRIIHFTNGKVRAK